VPLTFADVATSEYILLTTFTKDGRPKPTAIWAAPHGDRLVCITQEQSWKVRRIRNTSRVTVARCDRSGNSNGEAVEATAAIRARETTTGGHLRIIAMTANAMMAAAAPARARIVPRSAQCEMPSGPVAPRVRP